MVAVPVKPQYGPTLDQLLSSRWHSASAVVRAAAIAACVGVPALILAAALTLENATFSHGGRVPFSFSYRGLYRVAPDPGGYVKIERRHGGRLEDSFAVEPLRLPPYSGEVSGELPQYAAGHILALSRRYPDFVLRGEGKTSVPPIPAYNVFFTTVVDGRRMYGREALLARERPGSRDGVDIVMLSSAGAGTHLSALYELASGGVLSRPFKTFSLG
jgi:hypothetical protein